MLNKAKVKYLLDEFSTIHENCIHNAQGHFIMASRFRAQTWFLLVLPSSIAAIGGILAALDWQYSKPSGVVAAFFATVVTVASILGVDKKSDEHVQAGNVFTALRHDARSILETYWPDMTKDDLIKEARRLDDRYNTLIQMFESIDNKAYEEGRIRIMSGIYLPDFRTKQSEDN